MSGGYGVELSCVGEFDKRINSFCNHVTRVSFLWILRYGLISQPTQLFAKSNKIGDWQKISSDFCSLTMKLMNQTGIATEKLWNFVGRVRDTFDSRS